MEEKNLWWKPLLFKTVEELDTKIREFIDYCDTKAKPMTLERLSVFLDCETDTIRNYEKKDAYFGTIKKIRKLILADKVERLNDRTTFTPWIVFDLKNNHDWKDKIETDNTNHNNDITEHLTIEQQKAIAKRINNG